MKEILNTAQQKTIRMMLENEYTYDELKEEIRKLNEEV